MCYMNICNCKGLKFALRSMNLIYIVLGIAHSFDKNDTAEI